MEKVGAVDIVISCLRETLSEGDGQHEILLDSLSESTHLIGRASVVNSLGLVTLVVAIEQRLAENHGINITIADERALSQEKSPFRTVASLSNYLYHLITEQSYND